MADKALQAVILAGGQGTRLRPLTLARAKPVVPLLNRPFLAYQLALLRAHGVSDIVLACSYRVEDLRAALGDAEHLGVRLRYAIENEPLGTGGGVRNAADLSGLPPAYLCIGELDLMRDENIEYATRLMQAGVPTELHVYPGAFHGFEGLVPNAAVSVRAVNEYTEALKRGLSR